MLPAERPWALHAYHLYPIVVQTERLSADRDTIMNAIQAENVGIGVHFRAVHLHPYYAETFGFRRGMFPNAEGLLGPDDIAPALSEDDRRGRRRCRRGGAEGSVALPPVAVAKRKNRE